MMRQNNICDKRSIIHNEDIIVEYIVRYQLEFFGFFFFEGGVRFFQYAGCFDVCNSFPTE